MGKLKDLTGQKFGRLTVLKFAYTNKNKKRVYTCLCECGKTKDIVGASLLNGSTISCGCYQKSIASGVIFYNKYDLSNEYGIGYTSQNESFYFDLEDYDLIKGYTWNIKNDYVVSKTFGIWTNMTHLILHCDPNKVIDHRNHITSDNRKNNLRIVSIDENMFNKKKYKNNTSDFTGVRYNESSNKWIAVIGYNQKSIYLGSYNNKLEAIKARQLAENKYYGDLSYTKSISKNHNQN